MSALDFIAPLFVPAHRPERFEKAARSGADAVIIDIEDAVRPADKAAARQNLRTDFALLPVIIRVNAIGTPWHAEDVEAALALGPAAIMVPKTEHDAEFAALARSARPTVPLIAMIETVAGLAEARAIAALPGVERLAFGSWDFAADLGSDHGKSALLGARSEIVMASRLAGIPVAPLDGVTVSINDEDGVAADARYARSLGFGGKLVIHPRQVQAVFKGFAPSTKDVEWAGKIMVSGGAAVAVDGAMVDEPVRIRARAILAQAERLNIKE